MIRICRQKKSTVGLNLMVALIKLVISFSDLNYKLFLSISKNLEATYASSQKTPHNTTQQQANNNSGPVAFCLVKDPIKSSCPTHTLSLLFSSLLFSQTRFVSLSFLFFSPASSWFNWNPFSQFHWFLSYIRSHLFDSLACHILICRFLIHIVYF